jgi:hypothetical protein
MQARMRNINTYNMWRQEKNYISTANNYRLIKLQAEFYTTEINCWHMSKEQN